MVSLKESVKLEIDETHGHMPLTKWIHLRECQARNS